MRNPYKLEISLTFLFFFSCFNVNAQESMRFDNESKKLEFIRHSLAQEKHLRLSEHSHRYCQNMMTDLLSGKNFKAIEPDVRADSADDPRLAIWNQCREKDYTDFGIDYKSSFGWLPQLGDPPYRYYRIELDGNRKNGPEDMIYHESPSRPSNAETGYTWVNLKKCEIKETLYVTGSKRQITKKPGAAYLNTLVHYKKNLWVVDFVDGFKFSLFKRFNDGRIETCRWQLYNLN
jgi:hypothetical protein